MVWRLLRHNIKPGQLIGYGVANFVGLAIVLTAIQFYRDVTAAREDDDSFISRDYLILSKKVDGLGALMGSDVSFSKDEITQMEAQPWVAHVGRFTSSAFNVSASINMGGREMSTALFFESIPDEFFDVKPSHWSFDPEKPEVPIILSKDYLALYNFGFAASRGLPQVSEGMIGMIPLSVSVSGRGRQQYFPARIVGFSSRLNTIAVPEEFMEWANREFADKPVENPSRLIVEVSSPGDPAIDEYLSSHGYESAGDRINNSRTAYFLKIVTGVVVSVGGIISLLALFILLLSIYLLLQKNREKLRDLMLLGYSPRQVATYYYIIVASINVAVLAGAVAAVLVGRARWAEPLESIGIGVTSPWAVLGIGLAVVVGVTAINIAAISRNVSKIFRG